MKFVIQHVPGARSAHVAEMLKVVPDAIIVECRGNPMETFCRTLIAEPHWHLEDDIVFAPDFMDRANEAVRRMSTKVLQGFSLTQVEGKRGGSTFLMGQCFWLPYGYGPKIVEFIRTTKDRKKFEPTGFDVAVQRWLVATKIPYWVINPSLVQHDMITSLLGKRFRKRQSPSFAEAYPEVMLSGQSTK